jgi:hypothetical protein
VCRSALRLLKICSRILTGRWDRVVSCIQPGAETRKGASRPPLWLRGNLQPRAEAEALGAQIIIHPCASVKEGDDFFRHDFFSRKRPRHPPRGKRLAAAAYSSYKLSSVERQTIGINLVATRFHGRVLASSRRVRLLTSSPTILTGALK